DTSTIPSGLASVEDALLCGVDCGHGDLAEYCADRLAEPWCGGEWSSDGFNIEASCSLWSTTRFGESSCRHNIAIHDPSGHALWHFDAQDQLVGALFERQPRRLGTYCKTQTLGQLCSFQGTPVDLCVAGGCEEVEPYEPSRSLLVQTCVPNRY